METIFWKREESTKWSLSNHFEEKNIAQSDARTLYLCILEGWIEKKVDKNALSKNCKKSFAMIKKSLGRQCKFPMVIGEHAWKHCLIFLHCNGHFQFSFAKKMKNSRKISDTKDAAVENFSIRGETFWCNALGD